MLSSKDATLVYETLLMSPGMNDNVKLPLILKRKTVLMLAKVVDQALSKETPGERVLYVMDTEAKEELKGISKGLLEKSGLTELNERLETLNLK